MLAACKSGGGARLLHESESQFGHLVVREESPGIRTLQFEHGGAIQSRVNLEDPMDLRLVYTRATMLALAVKPKPRRVLVLGLGGGAMPRFFYRALPEAQIDVLELDPAVVKLAKQYFELPEDPRINVRVGDGRKSIQDAKGGWDLVVLDAYSADDIPRHLATAEFLGEVKAKLAPGAVVAGNVWSRDHNGLYDSMAKTWADTFSSLCIVTIEASANRIFLAASDPAVDVSANGVRVAAAKLEAFPAVKEYAPAECSRDGWETAEPLRDLR
ncbi:MAG: fused MFS/spermidine synthase [Myxococcaceae bacterium]|nr:fused MFS/spermidine synthase [Myxococcaceae bacterium]